MNLSGAEKTACINVLLRGAQRYHFASLQDLNPIVAARHNGYAVALISVLRDVATEEEVLRVAGISTKALYDEILKVQDKIEGVAIKLYMKLQKAGFEIPGLDLRQVLMGG